MIRVVNAIYDLFSSVRFGIVLLVLLFIFMSVGSAGIVYPVHPNLFHPDAWVHQQMRQWRAFEMTEFEWFHWWPFNALIAMIATTLVVTTLRRIPFRVVNLGVWTIHTGVIVLIVGSFIYFQTKVEGDAPVARRKVVLTVQGVEGTVELLAAMGATATIGSGDSAMTIEVAEIDPEWELRSGSDAGDLSYSVKLLVTTATDRFIRQLIANHPQYTEDILFTDDPAQPMKRAIKERGQALVESRLTASLDYESQQYFYVRNDLTKAWALYLRSKGSAMWIERPMEGVPLYNDSISSHGDVFESPSTTAAPLHPMHVLVPAVAANDPCADVTFSIDGYLRYAQTKTRLLSGGAQSPFAPAASIEVRGAEGAQTTYQLMAFDPERSSGDGGLIRMVALTSEEQLAKLQGVSQIRCVIPAANIDVIEPVRLPAEGDQDAFMPIGGAESGYGFRVIAAQDELPIGGKTTSVLIIELKTPTTTIRRWVFDEPSLTRDVPANDGGHGAPIPPDPSVQVEYQRGAGRAILTLAVGPGENQLRIVTAVGNTAAKVQSVSVDESITLPAGLSLRVTSYLPRARIETRPVAVPESQRIRDARELFAQVLVNVPGSSSRWMEFSPYAVDDARFALRRHPYHPSTVTLADGREIELLFSRRRIPLNTDIALEEFVLTSHEGGYTGEGGSIRDYTSLVRFRDASTGGEWSDPTAVSVNSPIEHNGLWYFQAQWDPPEPASQQDRGSRGLNYTVLGVGNRRGVQTQLAGCIIAVMGMLYAFYVKPVIIRRRTARAKAVAVSRPVQANAAVQS